MEIATNAFGKYFVGAIIKLNRNSFENLTLDYSVTRLIVAISWKEGIPVIR